MLFFIYKLLESRNYFDSNNCQVVNGELIGKKGARGKKPISGVGVVSTFEQFIKIFKQTNARNNGNKIN
jgi:hypothetical protein